MKKNWFPFFILSFLCLFFCLSCIDKDYDIDDINKDYQIGSDGFIFSVGDLEIYTLKDKEHVSSSENITYNQRVSVLSEDFFDYFIYEFAGEEQAIGSIRLKGNVVAGIENHQDMRGLTLTLEAYIENPNGND